MIHINNMLIIFDNGKWKVSAPDGKVLKQFTDISAAKKYATEKLDYIK